METYEKSHLINEILRTWNYYYEKFPLYLQNSYGFTNQFYSLFELLCQIELNGANLLDSFALFDIDKYKKFMNQYSDNEYKFDVLDNIAKIYGINRSFDLVINNTTYNLTLNNEDLLTLTLAKVILASFEGSYESARYLYDKIQLPIYIFTEEDSPTVSLYLNSGKYNIDNKENIKLMFEAGMFNLQSLGIQYKTNVVNISNIAIWDSTNKDHFWNVGLWS